MRRMRLENNRQDKKHVAKGSIEILPYSVDNITKEPVHYPRYGDSNWLALKNHPKPNCDGHKHNLPGLKEDILKTVRRPKDMVYGLTPFAMKKCLVAIVASASNNIRWRNGDIWMDAVLVGNMGPFVKFLSAHRVFVVGPRHFTTILPMIGCVEYFMTNSQDCYLQKNDILRAVSSSKSAFDVCIFAASMLSCVAIYELHEYFHDKWLIDVGAGLDPMAGVLSRVYHGKAKNKKNCYASNS